ncbi:MAG: hypothetical protein U9N56_05715 [Actinomycetota bacterium]|nr:hypothetical protein [Actinomycetota bacterium]
MTKQWTRLATLVVFGLVLSACGDTPLISIGERSSGWINEPEVITTTQPPTTVPLIADVSTLQWANDDIVTLNLDDPAALVAEIFQRREGDRFIQASRAEIAAALPGVSFPAVVPHGAQWVSSQLVIENSGDLSTDPSAAFGIWSAEPYTRSRSVAQMATLVVANDADGSLQVTEGAEEVSCAALADQTTIQCDILDMPGRKVWRLVSSSGETFIWFDEVRRYELFGRSYVPDEAMTRMVSELTFLEDVEPTAS